MGCQVCKLQSQNEFNTQKSVISLTLQQSIIQEIPAQLSLKNMEIRSTPNFQNDRKWILAPSIDFDLNDEFIVDHRSLNSSNQVKTLNQILSAMTGKGNLIIDAIDQKSQPNRKSSKTRRRKLQMKDLEREF